MPIRTISAELQKESESILNEVPNRVQSDIEEIQSWLSHQPHLNTVKTDDQWIVAFLRGCKFSTQLAKDKLDLHYTVRSALPELYDGRNPFSPDVQEILESGVILPLPKTAGPANSKVILIRSQVMDASRYPLTALVKVFLMILDILLQEDDNCVIGGQTVVLDLKGLTLDIVAQATLKLIKSVAICLQHAYPIRPKHIYIINSKQIFDNLYTTIKYFITKEVRDRIQFVEEAEICNLTSKDVMSSEYGGDESTSLKDVTAYWKAKVESYKDWFLQEEKYRSDETKRTEINKIADSLFGLDGSFKKLDID